jgi:hypothetical protein
MNMPLVQVGVGGHRIVVEQMVLVEILMQVLELLYQFMIWTHKIIMEEVEVEVMVLILVMPQ